MVHHRPEQTHNQAQSQKIIQMMAAPTAPKIPTPANINRHLQT